MREGKGEGEGERETLHTSERDIYREGEGEGERERGRLFMAYYKRGPVIT